MYVRGTTKFMRTGFGERGFKYFEQNDTNLVGQRWHQPGDLFDIRDDILLWLQRGTRAAGGERAAAGQGQVETLEGQVDTLRGLLQLQGPEPQPATNAHGAVDMPWPDSLTSDIACQM